MSNVTSLAVADLPQNRPTKFNLQPNESQLRDVATELNLSAARKMSFVGQISAQGRHNWVLKARLGATVVQPCVITLEPVTTRIDTNVQRVFLATLPDPGLGEVEMHDDENIELLGSAIDPYVVMIETLTLNLPQYPRKKDANLGESVFTEPGQVPMTDEDARPFAGLADLSKALKGDT
jgi:uncharacterized metal-binding protein YceD (DUF177 family)